MIDLSVFSSLVETYRKHGWELRRVLVSAADKETLEAKLGGQFANVKIVASEIDAAWFSRPPKEGGGAWELRYLGDIAYALVENFDENAPEFEEKISEVVSKLIDAIAKKRKA